MNKKEFTKKILNMEKPVLSFLSDDFYPFLSCYAYIHDDKNILNKFIAQTVRLSRMEYLSRNHDGYFLREKNMRRKIEKWFHNITGENNDKST